MLAELLIGMTALVGQLLDARTTQVGLKAGDSEQNGLMAGLIGRIGIPGFYLFKAGLAVGATALAISFQLGPELTAIGVGAFAVAGFGAGIINWRSLEKQGIKVF